MQPWPDPTFDMIDKAPRMTKGPCAASTAHDRRREAHPVKFANRPYVLPKTYVGKSAGSARAS